MGVPRLDRYIRVNYAKHITFFHPDDSSKHIHPTVLCIDSNPLIHKAAQIVFNYGAMKRRLWRYESWGFTEKVNQVYVLYFQYLKEVVKLAHPKKTLYIAVDGVAPLAKQIQQRQRRFRAASAALKPESSNVEGFRAASAALKPESNSVDENDNSFDSNCITAGTLFMHNLTKYINYHIRREMEYGEWKGLEVIFSPHTSPGEGEHTCLDYIRSLKGKETVCMFGPDGDLLMLGLVTSRQFYLLKEDMYTEEQWYVVDCTAIRSELVYDMGLVKRNTRNERVGNITDRGVADFILLGFFLGNDFLPKIEMFYLLEDGLELFIKTYKIVIAPSHKFLVNEYGEIDRENFRLFLEHIQREEIKYLTRQDDNEVFDARFENKTLRECITYTKTHTGVTKVLDFNKYSKMYYERKLDGAHPSNVVYSYLDGMKWVLWYYLYGCPTPEWVYAYHYPPFVIDILEHLNTWSEPTFVDQPSHLPFEQLIGVLPPSSFDLLPKPFRSLLYDDELQSFFSTNITVDYEGKKQEYQGIVRIPLIDFRIIRNAYTNITLHKHYDRNTPSTDKLMVVDTNTTYKYTSEYGTIEKCHVKVSEV